MNPDFGNRELQTWQEISAYLKVSIRSAQAYEKNAGLPVHRMPGKKARVWAVPAELDAWKTRGDVAEPEPPPGRSWRWFAVGTGIALLLLGITGALWSFHLSQRIPSQIQVRGSVLTVLDGEGHPLWQHTFPESMQESVFEDPDTGHQRYQFVDIDGDGRVELLFAYSFPNITNPGSALYCFSSSGKIKWKYTPGHSVFDQQQEIDPLYSITGIEVLPASRRGGFRIIVNSLHAWSYPDVVEVLDPKGSVEGEYFHSGHTPVMKLVDLDGDNEPELLLGGVAEGYERATLVVLDPRHLFGGSTQPPGDRHQFRNLATGVEKIVVFFPRSCITAQLAEHNRLYLLKVLGDRMLVSVMESVTVQDPASPYIIYELTRGLQLRNLVVSDQFVSRHRELEAQHLLHHAYSAKTCVPLKEFTVLRSPAA